MEVSSLIHEMNGVIQEYNLLQLRMNDLGMKLSGLHAKVSYYLNTRKDLYADQQNGTGDPQQDSNLQTQAD